MLHGAMETSRSHLQLAAALADTYTVYLPDRRGRGLSGPYGRDYTPQEDIDDMDALLTQTGAHLVFGVSAGALIWLQAALTLPAIHKAALYEPPLIVNGSARTDYLARLDQELAQGKVAAALITGMKGAQMGPPIFNAMPRWLMESLTQRMMAQEDQRAAQGDVTMRMLAPTLHYDFELVAAMADTLDRYKAVQVPILLLGGSKSPRYLHVALDALEQVLPHMQRIEFAGLDHGASSDASATNRTGKPEIVAQALHQFFA